MKYNFQQRGLTQKNSRIIAAPCISKLTCYRMKYQFYKWSTLF